MTKKDYTHITLVVDRSGSMTGIQREAQGAINAYLAEQAELPGECSVTLVDFDTEHRVVYSGPLADCGPYTLSPRWFTALNDAIGKSIIETGEYLAAKKEKDRPSKVLFVIVTDGGENASVEYQLHQVKEMIAKQEADYQWQFVFLSSDLNAQQQARGYGVHNSVVMAAGASAYQGTMSVLSANTRAYRGAGGQSMPRMPEQVDADGNAQ